MNEQTTPYRTGVVSLAVLFVVGTLVVSLPTGAVSPQSTVEAGSTISTAGTYELAPYTANTTESNGLTVTGSPVEIDGRQNRLVGPETAGSVGVSAPDGADESSLVVRNLTLSGWETGVRTSNVSTVTIRDTVVRSNHTGVRISGAQTVRIEDSTLVVDEGTVFEDVGRVVLENTSIRTVDTESIVAVNTSVYVGRNVRLTGGVQVRRGIVKLAPNTATPTPPTGVESILRGGGGGGGGVDGAGSGGGPPQDVTTTPAETTHSKETIAASNTTTPTVPKDPESTVEPTNTTGVSRAHGPESTVSHEHASSPTTDADSTVATAHAEGADESTAVRTPGFGGVVALTALGAWSVRRLRAD